MENTFLSLVPDEVILNKILLLRGVRVIVDRDIASLYGVETKVLNQAVKRNIRRFPADFMFQMSEEEFKNWKSQFVTSKNERMGLRKKPFVFTEQGIAMLSGVIGSEIAITVSIQIIRVFVRLREILVQNAEILQKIEEIQRKDIEQDQAIMLIFQYLKQMEQLRSDNSEPQTRRRIGFQSGNKTDQND